MGDHEAAKWAVGSEFASDISGKDENFDPMGTPSGTPGGTGWPGQSARFLHVAAPRNHARFVHDSVMARLSPEDIKKARELKQSTARPVRQKVRKEMRVHKHNCVVILSFFNNANNILLMKMEISSKPLGMVQTSKCKNRKNKTSLLFIIFFS